MSGHGVPGGRRGGDHWQVNGPYPPTRRVLAAALGETRARGAPWRRARASPPRLGRPGRCQLPDVVTAWRNASLQPSRVLCALAASMKVAGPVGALGSGMVLQFGFTSCRLTSKFQKADSAGCGGNAVCGIS